MTEHPQQLPFKSNVDWVLLALLLFVPRLLNLNVFLTPDEPLFLEHARQFAHGVATGNFAETLGIGYPGVTIALVAAPVVNLPATELGAYVAGRVAVVLLNGLLTLILYGLAKKLLGNWPALVGGLLLALDPYTLGYSRLLHNEATLSLTMTLVGLALLLWLHSKRRRWLLLVGLFTGLALLSKSTALLAGPMLAVATLGWAVGSGGWRDGRWWSRLLLGGAAALGVAAVVFFVLWPAMWVDPAGALELTFSKLFRDQEAGVGNFGLFWFGRFIQNPGPAFYPLNFLLKATPWLIIGLLLNLFFLFSSQLKIQNSKFKIIYLWLFALTYFLLMTIASKKSVRYMLPAWPTFALLAGWGWVRASESASQQIGAIRNSQFIIHYSQFIILLLVAVFAFVYHPYYFSYYNPALLGWRWAPQTMLVGWGEGLDLAADYLNRQPPGNVAAWYEFLFPLYYHGQTEAVVPADNLLTADHAVLYINQVQRDIPNPNIVDYFRSRRQPEYTARINGIDYAWVYSGPVVGATAAPQPQVPLAGQFADELQLLGYSLHSSNSLIVTLNWRVLSPPSAERFVFTRLVDADGRVWASADSPPVMGLWPAARWQSGVLIEDAQALLIPAGTPPGTYRLEAGVYDPATGQPLPAAGQPLGPGGGLLLGEVPVQWTPRSRLDTDLPQAANARLSPNVTLLGYTPLPAAATTGDVLPLQLGWQQQRSWLQFGAPAEDSVQFDWRTAQARVAQQLDPLPLPVDQWGRGAVLRSQHGLVVPPALTGGEYDVWLALVADGAAVGEPFLLGTVSVSAPPHNFTLPAAVTPSAGPARLTESPAATVTLAGYQFDPAAGQVTLYWQTDGPLSAGYKVFVQLLDSNGQLLAQSDAVPAQGQRPTTGWLPGEIITDAHTLSLPADVPPGSPVRLIAGLYNPVDGSRLPLADGRGDAITVAEVSAP